ncbi:MAG: S8 family serine peptidase [Planctomycetales bacterium]|nr:S8 family serine peptidase [Planctomycetales bacterium]
MRNTYFAGGSGRTPERRSNRRPAGISRRQKRRLGFEPLEDRRVMSADSGVATLAALNDASVQGQFSSLSSDTLEGYLAILQNELFWQALSATSASGAAPTTLSVPTDPLVGNQWHLINSGQEVGNPDFQKIFGVPGEDINVAPVWNQGIFGNGVVVAVIDSGIQKDHPDLFANISSTLELDARTGDGDASPRPDLLDPSVAHGTAVAGIIAAMANNGVGGTGIAPGATLVPIRAIDPTSPITVQTDPFVDIFRYATDQIDITNNSWGPGVVRGLAGPTADELLAIRDSIFFGRDGLGVIHVFSSGNSGGSGAPIGFPSVGGLDTSAYNGWVNSRYTIGVTGVDHDGIYENDDGTVTGYPETATSVLIAAPTGSNAGQTIADDTGLGSGIWTTDLTGTAESGLGGFNIAPDPITGQEFDRDFFDDTDYTTRFNGTSAAAPMVTGVIALMLEANPNLSWRDVQEILVRSARQNSQFDVPESGYDLGLNQGLPNGGNIGGTQNLWITNQMPVFHDPDLYDPAIDPTIQTVTPTLDPNLTAASGDSGDGDWIAYHYQPTVNNLTNGAGYTVSLGRGTKGEMIGFGHGVVDAELAVALAQQWTTKGQSLPTERTYTSFWLNPGDEIEGGGIPGREVSDNPSGNQLVPGGLGGTAGFIAYWNEYFAAAPFSDPAPPDNTRGAPLFFTVPDSNTMSVETVEVKLSLSGGTAAALDHLRILLVSPDGTQSELNNFYVQPGNGAAILQNASEFTYELAPGSVDTTGGSMVWTFNTNQSWGERSDDNLVFDPLTGEPIINTTGFEALRGNHAGGNTAALTPATLGAALEGGWQLHFENYGTTPFVLDGVEVAWHGSPVGANTKRVQGFVGLDENRDDDFNYSRALPTEQVFDLDGDPATVRFLEFDNLVDLEQEAFAANVTVIARRASDGVIVDRFVTGADGNYYFDLVPDDYIISIEDPLGRTAEEDTTTAAGFLRHYKSEWEITSDYFKVWDRAANLEVNVDGSGTPLAWLDGNGAEQEYHVKGINFLLDPGAPVADQADFSGVVFADTNADGVFNSDDVLMPNVSVFADTNRNGVRDAGEAVVDTDATGAYTLTVPITSASVINVTVDLPANWQITSPEEGLDTRFAVPGDAFSGVDFAIAPPLNSAPGVGIAQPGIVLGVVYEDANVNGSRQTGEAGVQGITVYVDVNNSGVLDAGDIQTVTNEHGAFVFTELPPQNNIVVRAVVTSPFSQIVPFANGPYIVNLASGDTVSGVAFGLKNSAILDYGDLPAIYGATTLAENGARHKKGIYYLGASVDADVNGQPNLAATGDDANGIDDEDGVTLNPLVAGTNTATVVASRHGGYLTGWMDFNDDGDFDDAGERLTFTLVGSTGPQVGTKVLLDAGSNDVSFEVPVGVTASNVYARFRYGEYGIDSIYGSALIGEVEDYRLPVAAVSTLSTEEPDVNGDQVVNGADFLAWQRGYGKTSGATQSDGDANGDGAVDGADLGMLMEHFGDGNGVVQVAAALEVPATGDFDADGGVAGADFLAWQRGFSQQTGVNLYTGDGNSDGNVDGSDLATWQAQFGAGTTPSTVFEPTASALGAIESTSLQAIAAPVDSGAEQLDSQSLVDVARFASRPEPRGEHRGFLGRHDGVESHVDAPVADLRIGANRRDEAFGDFVASRRHGLRHERVEQFDDGDIDDALTSALADEAYWRFG